MARRNLKDCVWTMGTIRKIWIENRLTDETDKADSNIGSRFNTILKDKLNMSEKEINLYKSITPSGEAGQYILGGSDAPLYLKQFFDIFKNDYITAKEKKQIYFCLIGFLPSIRNAKECKAEQERVNALLSAEGGTGEGLTWDDSYLDGYRQNQEIKDIVEKFYIESRVPAFFEKRVFWVVDGKVITNGNTRKQIYGYQYNLVKLWEKKWNYIMNKALWIRKAERFDNGYEKCLELKLEEKDRQKFYATGTCNNAELEKSCRTKIWLDSTDLCHILRSEYIEQETPVYNDTSKTCEDCKKDCNNAISNILEHNLKHVHKSDFNYMKGQAFEELEDIRPKVRKKQLEDIYSSETGDAEQNRLKQLYAIRHKRNSGNTKRNIMDLI